MMWWMLNLCLAAEPTEPRPTEEDTETVEPDSAGPDRSARPSIREPSPMRLSSAAIYELTPSATVYFVEVPGARKVTLNFQLHRGTIDLDGWPTSSAWATGYMMDVATEQFGPAEIEELSALHDLWISSYGTGFHSQGLMMSAPRESLDQAMALFQDTVRHPAYPRKELKRLAREQAYYWTRSAPASAGSVASRAMRHSWYEPDHPYGAPVDLETLGNISPSLLHQQHARLFMDGPIEIVVAGDVQWEELKPMLDTLVRDLGATGERRDVDVHEYAGTSKIVAVDMPGAVQSSIRMRLQAPRADHPDRTAAYAVNFALGGHFLSRLNRNLREDKGYTYGSGSRLNTGRSSGTWDISVDVQTQDVAEAMVEIERELALIAADGAEPSEIEAAWLEDIQTWNRTMLTASTALSRWAYLLEEEKSIEDALEFLDALRALSPVDTQQVAERWLGADQARVWVVTGDRATLESELAESGLEVSWHTPEDAISGRF